MQRSEVAIRHSAVQRGLKFIYDFACDPACFREHGSGLLCCFQNIAATASDPRLKQTALRFGRERARQWRAMWPSPPRKTNPAAIIDLILGSDAADWLGATDPRMKQRLAAVATRFSVSQFLDFDPAKEPPPGDVPEECDCGADNKRGRRRCSDCKEPLTRLSRYRVWYYALANVYGCGSYGIGLGAQPKDILKWLPTLRPYPERANDPNDDFFDCVFAITHLVYALNNYNTFRLSPRDLPQEFTFLRTNVAEAVDKKDVEMVGEIVDCLKAFGVSDVNPAIRVARDYLLSSQNKDGSWGDPKEDKYTRYHSTWTGIDGLRDFDWQPRRRSKVRALLVQ